MVTVHIRSDTGQVRVENWTEERIADRDRPFIENGNLYLQTHVESGVEILTPLLREVWEVVEELASITIGKGEGYEKLTALIHSNVLRLGKVLQTYLGIEKFILKKRRGQQLDYQTVLHELEDLSAENLAIYKILELPARMLSTVETKSDAENTIKQVLIALSRYETALSGRIRAVYNIQQRLSQRREKIKYGFFDYREDRKSLAAVVAHEHQMRKTLDYWRIHFDHIFHFTKT